MSGVIERASQRLGPAESVVVKREEHVAGLRRVAERMGKLLADSKLAASG
jgi:threonine aldolase